MSHAEIDSVPDTHNPRKAFAFAFLASLFISLAQYYFKISSHSGGSGGAFEILVHPAVYLGLGFYLLSFYWTMRAYQWEGISFVLPVVSAIAHSANVLDCLVWSLVALIVQIVVYYLVKIPVPNLSQRIAEGQMAPAIWLGLSSLAAGALNAASMIT